MMSSVVIALGFGFVGQDDAVAQDVGADALDVLGRDVSAALEQRPGLGGDGEVDGGARGGAELDEMLDIEFVFLRRARGEDEMDDVIADFFVHVDLVHEFAGVENFLERDDGLTSFLGAVKAILSRILRSSSKVGITDDDLEHEAVHLRFGQRIGAFLVNGIFRGRARETARAAASFRRRG